MKTEIISVGTELLLGHVTNTDSRDVSYALSKIGIDVMWHTVVGDNPERLRRCVEIAKDRADIIITTGGLGPTCDDLTKQVIAEAFGLKLVKNEAEFLSLYDYIRPDKPFTENNFSQAYLPEGSVAFHNSCGTAPGCAFFKDGITVAMLPGPPKECAAMIESGLLPYLRALSNETLVSHCINIFGLAESTIDQKYRERMNSMSNPSMAPYAKECDCLLKLSAKASSEAEAEAMLSPFIDELLSELGDYVYGIDADSLEQAALSLLKGKGKRLAIGESGTGGAVTAFFTALPGSAEAFAGGKILPEETFSEEAACSLAREVRNEYSADLGISVLLSRDNRVILCLAGDDGCSVRKEFLGKVRSGSFLRRMSANHAFNLLRLNLKEL